MQLTRDPPSARGSLGTSRGITSAIVLAMIALLIAYESVSGLLTPVNIDLNQAIPIAVFGLVVSLVSAGHSRYFQ